MYTTFLFRCNKYVYHLDLILYNTYMSNMYTYILSQKKELKKIKKKKINIWIDMLHTFFFKVSIFTASYFNAYIYYIYKYT